MIHSMNWILLPIRCQHDAAIAAASRLPLHRVTTGGGNPARKHQDMDMRFERKVRYFSARAPTQQTQRQTHLAQPGVISCKPCQVLTRLGGYESPTAAIPRMPCDHEPSGLVMMTETRTSCLIRGRVSETGILWTNMVPSEHAQQVGLQLQRHIRQQPQLQGQGKP